MDLSVFIEQFEKAHKILKAVLAIFLDTPKTFKEVTTFATNASDYWEKTAGLFKAAEPAPDAAEKKM